MRTPIFLAAVLSALPLVAACQQRYDHVSHPIPYKNTDKWSADAKPEDAKAVSTSFHLKNRKAPMDFVLRDNAGEKYSLTQHKGKVVLLVNTASRCGFTRQYQGLQWLHEKYGPAGLVVIAVPANDFNEQEPGTDAQILQFCQSRFRVSFPIMAKTHVKGPEIHPLYEFLVTPVDVVNPAAETNPKGIEPYLADGDANRFKGPVTWNFEKFLIGRDGSVVGRFAPSLDPRDPPLVAAVEKALKAAAPETPGSGPAAR